MISPRINLVTLGVAEIARSRAFYEKLGFKASSAGNDDVAFFSANGIVLALFGHQALADDAHVARAEMPSFRGVSLAWNCASEAETTAVMAHAEACGAKILKPAQKVFWGGFSGYFADPDGHLWEVAHNPFFVLDANMHLTLP